MSNKHAFEIWRKKGSEFFDHSTTFIYISVSAKPKPMQIILDVHLKAVLNIINNI